MTPKIKVYNNMTTLRTRAAFYPLNRGQVRFPAEYAEVSKNLAILMLYL